MSLIAAARACQVFEVSDKAWNIVGVDEIRAVNLRAGMYECSCGTEKCAHVMAVVLSRSHPGEGDEESPPTVGAIVPDRMVDGREVIDVLFEDSVGPLPSWVHEIRPHQATAVDEIVDAYARGADVVVLDAPTGSGKTLIAELVRRRLKTNAVYVCNTIQLQDQFMQDFPYAKLLKGRANYPTRVRESEWPRWSAADCAGPKLCDLCVHHSVCPYQRAKQDALGARLAVLNTSYLLSAANHNKKDFNANAFVVVDECDTLEDVLMRFVEFRITQRMCRELGVWAPKKGSHKTTLSAWLIDVFVPACEVKVKELKRLGDAHAAKSITRFEQLRRQAETVALHIGDDEDADADNWIRDNDAGPLVLRPITVAAYGMRRLWQYGEKWLLMSASVISTEEMVASLGMEGLAVQTVTVPMTFPVENRVVHVASVAKITRDAKANGGWMRVARAVEKVCERHKGMKVLVHCVSYEFTKYLEAEFRNSQTGRVRPSFTYTSSQAKGYALSEWRASRDGVMFAPSLDRGVDLVGDDCRVQIIAKVPFPYLGDPQVSARLHSGRAGGHWYATKTVRTLVQMTGRSVRSDSDWATTYILDGQFMTNVWKERKMFFPAWWREAVDMTFNVRALMRGELE